MHEKHKAYNLFLDDERSPLDVKWIELPLVEWVVVRSYNAFVKHINEHGVPQRISFDHDLADEHYKEYHNSRKNGKNFNYEVLTEKTGRDAAFWLANLCVDNKIPIPEYYLHTMNGIGLNNMCSILESARKVISLT